MRLDDLRGGLRAAADRAPSGKPHPRPSVLDRGRRLRRRRRFAEAAGAIVVVAAVVGGIVWLESSRGPGHHTVVTSPSTSAAPSTANTTVPAPASTVPASVPPVTANHGVVPSTVAGPPPSDRTLISPDAGYSFTSTPVLSGDSLFAIESGHGADSQVVRIDLSTRAIVSRVYMPGASASALAVADGRLWVGVGSGPAGPFAAPPIQHLVGLDPQTFATRGNLAIPGPGTYRVAAAAGSIWVLSGDQAIRFDPATVTIAASFTLALPVSNPYRTLAVSNDGTRLYIGWATARQVEGVTAYDASNGHKVSQNGRVGGGPSNVGPELAFQANGGRLWATFPTGTEAGALALNTATLAANPGEVIGGPNSLVITPDGAVVWAGGGVQIDCDKPTGVVLASHTFSGGVIGGVAPTAATVYVPTTDGIAVVARDPACVS